MKHGNGIKDRDDKSNGVEILMADVFAKINPTDPLRLGKQVVRRDEIDVIPPDRFLGTVPEIDVLVFLFNIRGKTRAKENIYRWVSV
jgi:hypothetical protein